MATVLKAKDGAVVQIKQKVTNELKRELKAAKLNDLRVQSEDIYSYQKSIERIVHVSGFDETVLLASMRILINLLIDYRYFVEANSVSKKYNL